jgi:clan AA aspartic protease (TIGR02281 family)
MLKYNALVSSNTVLQVRWDRLREARAACRTEGEDACRKMNAYLEAIQLFCARFESERKPPAQDREGADRQPFLEELGSRLAAYLRDFAAVEAPVTRMGGGASVAAVVNGEHPARLLVDTGASCVMVTETFVRRMKVDPATLPEAEFTVADGRKIMGHSMTFRTLAVGGAQAENVEAGVLPEKPNESLDGLLGMSFLRHFTVRLDGASGKMTLWQFQPKRAGGAPAAGAP